MVIYPCWDKSWSILVKYADVLKVVIVTCIEWIFISVSMWWYFVDKPQGYILDLRYSTCNKFQSNTILSSSNLNRHIFLNGIMMLSCAHEEHVTWRKSTYYLGERKIFPSATAFQVHDVLNDVSNDILLHSLYPRSRWIIYHTGVMRSYIFSSIIGGCNNWTW